MPAITWGTWFRFHEGSCIALRDGRKHPEQVRCHAYRCVGVAARNRQNQPRPSSPLRPVVTGHVRDSTPSHGFWFILVPDWLSAPAAMRNGIGLRKLGAEQKDLGGIVNPQQQHDETSGSTVT